MLMKTLSFGFLTHSVGHAVSHPGAFLQGFQASPTGPVLGVGLQVSLTVSIGRGFDAATQLPSIFQLTGSVGTVHPHTRIFNHSC